MTTTPTYPGGLQEIEPGHRVTLTLPDATARTADVLELDVTRMGSTVRVRPTPADPAALPDPCPAAWVTAYLGLTPQAYLVEAQAATLAADLTTAASSTHDTAYFAAVVRLAAVLSAAIAV